VTGVRRMHQERDLLLLTTARAMRLGQASAEEYAAEANKISTILGLQ
jgi:hypothetical protein